MVPTLYGRIQTRIVLLIVVGGIWTLIITPFLPTGEPLGKSYQTTFLVLLTVLVLGVHLGVRLPRPPAVPLGEGLADVLRPAHDDQRGHRGLAVASRAAWCPASATVPLSAFLIQFITTWLVVWLVANGPVQIFFSRWRFRGGRFW